MRGQVQKIAWVMAVALSAGLMMAGAASAGAPQAKTKKKQPAKQTETQDQTDQQQTDQQKLAADVTSGTWKLNAAKSKPAPGGAKYDTVAITSEGANTKVTLDGTDTAGKPVHSEWVGKYDGEQYPVKGNPDMETGAYKKIDDHTFEYTGMKGGKPTTSAKITYSADGKSRTVNSSVTDAKGKKVSGMSVYEKPADQQKAAEQQQDQPKQLFTGKVKLTSSRQGKNTASAGFNGVGTDGKVKEALLNANPSADAKAKAAQLTLLEADASEVQAFAKEGKLNPPPGKSGDKKGK